ncbi:MAG: 50S ribosomal protein L17 [Candidatus Lloydbacteria bacterium RIFCSPHIGHO2_01_FULL_41_20]|uniref:Large ribosomal subunit protein bL17 n=1 Tax=Candidatus Lloydbacteria bacterium RIFCSPHIGHO2_01_FULL_41_20 TaxID=1798657 RepID=A0A1G2CR04_9BACT|nr:MAG: 50S ribosomal protein L17 [Candidatus Lloydbacteria bacterium RIFCSPHIGHO2_01_FULL_41_20]
MRHHNKQRKFGRTSKVRSALLKSLLRSLILHGKISTTEAKAKEIRPIVEGLITKARIGTLASRRFVTAKLLNQNKISKKLCEEIAPKYKDRNGGYTRIIKLPRRKSDGSTMAVIEFI